MFYFDVFCFVLSCLIEFYLIFIFCFIFAKNKGRGRSGKEHKAGSVGWGGFGGKGNMIKIRVMKIK